jgi:hypothetical protein
MQSRDRARARRATRGYRARISVALSVLVISMLLTSIAHLLTGSDAEAAIGTRKWASAQQVFEFAGSNWSFGQGAAFAPSVAATDNTWRASTDWKPFLLSSSNNGVYWDEAASGGYGTVPALSHSLAVAARSLVLAPGGTFITEADIQFNGDPNTNWNWTSSLVIGVSTHEFGHTGGLLHDPDSICLGVGNRNTMCSGESLMMDQFKTISLATLESKDIADANAKY